MKQEDGAGLHNDKTYISEMKKEFWDKREWVNFNQSSQSPTFNVHDMCIFPVLSKRVSREQALSFGSTLLKGEQLNQTVMKVWADSSNLTAIARAFAGHWQIVLAAMYHEGDNTYLKEKGGLSFGIRLTFINNERGDGIIPVNLAPESEAETLSGSLLSENQASGLKYRSPKVRELTHAFLTSEMLLLLDRYMDKALMSDDHKMALLEQDEHCDTENDVSNMGEDEVSLLAEIESEDSGFSTETECMSYSSATLGEISSQSFDTVSED